MSSPNAPPEACGLNWSKGCTAWKWHQQAGICQWFVALWVHFDGLLHHFWGWCQPGGGYSLTFFHFQSLVTHLPHSPNQWAYVFYIYFFRPHHGQDRFLILFLFLNPASRLLPNKGKPLLCCLRYISSSWWYIVYHNDAWNLLWHMLGLFFFFLAKHQPVEQIIIII